MPLFHGLQEFLRTNEKKLYGSVIQCALDLLPSLPWGYNLKVRTSERPWLSDLQTQIFSMQATLFFDTAGTGKTTAAHEMVRDTFGFYCLSPNLPPSDVTVAQSVIAPDRACASRDTYSLYEDLKAFDAMFLEPPERGRQRGRVPPAMECH